MSHYLSTTSITDAVIIQFIAKSDSRLENWLSLVDAWVIGRAADFGLQQSQIIIPVHPRISEYMTAYFCFMVARDNIGVNNVDSPADEKYRVKFEEYAKELERVGKSIIKDMFWLSDASIAVEERIYGSTTMWRV